MGLGKDNLQIRIRHPDKSPSGRPIYRRNILSNHKCSCPRKVHSQTHISDTSISHDTRNNQSLRALLVGRKWREHLHENTFHGNVYTAGRTINVPRFLFRIALRHNQIIRVAHERSGNVSIYTRDGVYRPIDVDDDEDADGRMEIRPTRFVRPFGCAATALMMNDFQAAVCVCVCSLASSCHP